MSVSGYRDTIQTAEQLEAVKWSQVIVWKAADETKRFLKQRSWNRFSKTWRLSLFENVSHGFIVFDRFSRHVQQHEKKNRSSVMWFSIVMCHYVRRPSYMAAALLKRKQQTALNSSFHPKLIQNQIWTWWTWMIYWRAVVFGPHAAAELLPLVRPPGAAAGDLLTPPWTWRPRPANVHRSHSEPNAPTNHTHSDASAQDVPSGGGGGWWSWWRLNDVPVVLSTTHHIQVLNNTFMDQIPAELQTIPSASAVQLMLAC